MKPISLEIDTGLASIKAAEDLIEAFDSGIDETRQWRAENEVIDPLGGFDKDEF